eukprot:TRINITY_DN27021_c0_g1_i1.p1 TRINITY_DN27021_c0_g1~~TRINITY_DN27021_c0_g1_i1.p1  ORF type:complete len:907 (-),score=146.05 TRINITY_DN27021_c0_g1_i1:187-2808(-)
MLPALVPQNRSTSRSSTNRPLGKALRTPRSILGAHCQSTSADHFFDDDVVWDTGLAAFLPNRSGEGSSALSARDSFSPGIASLYSTLKGSDWLGATGGSLSSTAKAGGSLSARDVPGGAAAANMKRPGTDGGGSRALRCLSGFGQRANERAAEAFVEIVKEPLVAVQQNGGTAVTVAVNDPTTNVGNVTKAFEHICAGIEAALEGGQEATKTVKRNEVVFEQVPMHGLRHYKILLPPRPTAVTVTVSRTAGVFPEIWGSTSCPRPSEKDHEFKGKEEKLVYEHALMHPVDDEEGLGFVDRRSVVPKCRELFITVVAETGECSYRLVVTFGYIKIVLTRQELANQVKEMKRNWETRLAELQRDPVLKEQFEERVLSIKEERLASERARRRGLDFVSINSTSVDDFLPECRIVRAKKQALKRQGRELENLARRQDLEKEDEDRKTHWLTRSDDRRKMREQKEQQRHRELENQELQKDWFARLALVSFTTRAAETFKKQRELQRSLMRRLNSIHIINRFMTRASSWKRRHDLYRNVIRIRMGLLGYVRAMRPVIAQIAQPVVKDVLSRVVFHKEEPSLITILHKFRVNVLKLQRWFRSIKRMRYAFCSLVMPHWAALQTRLYKEIAQKKADAINADYQALAELHQAAKSRVSEIELKDRGKKQARQSARGTMSSIRSSVIITDKREVCAQDIHIEEMPVYMVKVLVYEYVVWMIKGRGARIEAWQKQKQADEWGQDLEAFGIVEEVEEEDQDPDAPRLPKKTRGRPTPIYIDPAELQERIDNAIQTWHSGGYAWLMLARRRLLQRPFRLWARLTKFGEKGIGKGSDVAPTGKGRGGDRDTTGPLAGGGGGRRGSAIGRRSSTSRAAHGRLGRQESV